jgi:hypothetical protein
MSASDPIAFEVERPPTFDRAHVFARLALLAVLGWVVQPVGLFWLGLPVVAAFLISRKGGQRYLDEDGATVAGVLTWVLDFVAYLALLTDKLPGGAEHSVRLQVERRGSPTARSALLRILNAIPSLIVLSVLTWVGTVIWMTALAFVLLNGRYPASMWRFLCGLVQWDARLLAYLASLVDEYPPFALKTGEVTAPSASGM